MPNPKDGKGSYKSFHGAERVFGILASFFSQGEILISYDFLCVHVQGQFFFPLKKAAIATTTHHRVLP